MAEKQPKAIYCPNCQQLANMTGNEITCENCDAVFVITKKQGAKVKQIGQIEDHEQRIARLEASDQPVEPTKPTEPVEEESEESIL